VRAELALLCDGEINPFASSQIPEHGFRLLRRAAQHATNGMDALDLQRMIVFEPTEVDERAACLLKPALAIGFRVDSAFAGCKRSGKDFQGAGERNDPDAKTSANARTSRFFSVHFGQPVPIFHQPVPK